MAEKIKISDLFDFSDVQDLEELYRRLEQINQIYKELAKNINQESQTINRGIEANVKEVKKLSDALRVASDTADIKKLSDQIEKQAEVSKKLTAQNDNLVEDNKKLKQSQKEVNEEGKEAERLLKEQNRLKAKITAATGEEAKQNAILKLQLAEVNKETKKQAKESIGLENAYQKLVRQTREAKNEAKRLGAELGTTSVRFLSAQKNAEKLDKELKELDASVGDFQRNVGNYQSALDGIGQGFSSVLEFATPAGLALAGVALAIEGIGALAETVQETNKQLSETATLTGLSGDELNKFTSTIRATSKTFDVEYKEVLTAVNTLQKEFGLTGEEALKLVNKGFLEGAGISDNYLDSIREYSTQFKAAGRSAEDFIDATIIQSTEGLFSDKFLDTVKESGLRLRELNKAQEDALKPLGEERTKLIKDLVSQGDSFEAASAVVAGLSEVNLTAKETQTIFADVFGGAGEDLGRRGLDLLATFEEQQNKINNEVSEQEKIRRRTLAVEQELAEAEVKLGQAFKSTGKDISLFFSQLQTLGIEGILSVIEDTKEGFNELAPLFNEVGEAIDDVSDALGLSGSGFLDFLKQFNPVKKAIDNVVLSFRVLLNIVLFVVDIFKTSLDVFIEVSSTLLRFARSFEPVNTAINKTVDLFRDLLNFFGQAPQFLTGLQNAFFETFKQIRRVFKENIVFVKDGLEGLFSLDFAKVKQAISAGTTNIKNGGKQIALAFQKGFEETAPISTAVKNDSEKAIKELDKQNANITKKAQEQSAKSKEVREKEFNEKLKTINTEFAKEESLLKDKRINQLKTEEEFQDDLLLLKLQRLESEKELLEQSGKDTAAVQRQIDDILLNEQRKSEKAGIEQQKKANKESERIDKEEAKRKKAQEQQDRQDRAEQASDPIVQASFDALEGKVQNELVAAGVSAFRASLENGDDLQTALANGTKAVAAGQVFKSLSKGFHDGGYTGDGNEYNVAGVVHKGEHVITKAQTTKYGLKGLTANDLDKAIETGYFNQFADTNNTTADNLNINKNIIVNNDNKEIVSKLDQLINAIPKEQLKEVGGLIQHVSKVGQIKKTTTFRSVR